jgi:hypothetical protein
MNIINVKKIQGIFDLIRVVEVWMNLDFYLRFYVQKRRSD